MNNYRKTSSNESSKQRFCSDYNKGMLSSYITTLYLNQILTLQSIRLYHNDRIMNLFTSKETVYFFKIPFETIISCYIFYVVYIFIVLKLNY